MANTARDRLRRHAWYLCRRIGERTCGHGLAAAEAYIQGEMAAVGLDVERQVYRFGGTDVANLVATAGPAGHAPVVVAAHYDTVPGTEGADDNASAVAVLLELAHRLARAPPTVPVRLAAFTLEEAPAFGSSMQGSRVCIERWQQIGVAPRAALVLEMVGYTADEQHYPGPLRWAGYPARGDFIGVVANMRSKAVRRRTERGLGQQPGLPVEGLTVPFDGWLLPDTRLSDHSAFWDAGWPAVMITDTAFFRNPNYHTPADRWETLDFTFMEHLVGGLVHAVESVGAPA